MREQRWIDYLNLTLTPRNNGPILNKDGLRDRWRVVCSFSDARTKFYTHAYQAVNEWNADRRGEKR